MRLRQRVREFAYAMGFGIDEEAERKVLDGEAGVPPGSLTSGKLMAVQIAKNKFTPDQDIEAVRRDYVYCVDQLARYADIIVVNVSSPNTPGLRALQD
ncbi:Dihydroorotate dehydrogenase (quinone), mitochondrial, partial [Cryomyces antarcticus]